LGISSPIATVLATWLTGRMLKRGIANVQQRVEQRMPYEPREPMQPLPVQPAPCVCPKPSTPEPQPIDDPPVVKETIERNRNHYVPVRDTSTDHAWAKAVAMVAEAYPGTKSYMQRVERVKDLILSGEEHPRV
jgi:hypothetical protein